MAEKKDTGLLRLSLSLSLTLSSSSPSLSRCLSLEVHNVVLISPRLYHRKTVPACVCVVCQPLLPACNNAQAFRLYCSIEALCSRLFTIFVDIQPAVCTKTQMGEQLSPCLPEKLLVDLLCVFANQHGALACLLFLPYFRDVHRVPLSSSCFQTWVLLSLAAAFPASLEVCACECVYI